MNNNKLLEYQMVGVDRGGVAVVSNVSIDVGFGQFVAITGPNGCGKTSVMLVAVGLLQHREGRVIVFENEIGKRRCHEIVEMGVSFVRERRNIFLQLTVEENLILSGWNSCGSKRQRELLDCFPILSDRRDLPAEVLSGGERSMLAIACAIARSPRLLVVDEFSEGLQPTIAMRTVDLLSHIKASDGLGMLFVEQAKKTMWMLADRVFELSPKGALEISREE